MRGLDSRGKESNLDTGAGNGAKPLEIQASRLPTIFECVTTPHRVTYKHPFTCVELQRHQWFLLVGCSGLNINYES